MNIGKQNSSLSIRVKCRNKISLRARLWFLAVIVMPGGLLVGCNLGNRTDPPQSQESSIPRGTPIIRNVLTRQSEIGSTKTLANSLLKSDAIATTSMAAESSLTVLATPTPAIQAQEPYLGIWINEEELARLPVSGPAWDQLLAAADTVLGQPNLRDQDQMHNVYVLAKALVYARTGDHTYRKQVIDNLMQAIGTEDGGRTLALGRELVAYVIAADLVNLPAEGAKDEQFRSWLDDTLTENLGDHTLQSTHELRPNNWGTHAGASRAAIAVYLGDQIELDRTARVFKGWLGDRAAYSGFDYGDHYWQADSEEPVGINPQGAEKDGYAIDGVLPEEMRRGGRFRWPPEETGYAWEALQGALVQAQILHRAGYDTWHWQDQALLRAAQFLYDIGWTPEGDDEWQPWLLNAVYGTSFPAPTIANPGKNMGWTNWTHAPSTTKGWIIDSRQPAH